MQALTVDIYSAWCFFYLTIFVKNLLLIFIKIDFYWC
jgi:hypothetical protein